MTHSHTDQIFVSRERGDLFPPAGEGELSTNPAVGRSESLLKKGGFLRRGLAFLVDLWVVYFIFLFFMWLAREAVHFAILEGGSFQENDPFADPLFFTVGWMWPFLFFFYFTFFSWSGGQTPGKKFAGLRIISKGRKDLSLAQSAGRTLSYLLSILSFGIGFYMALFSREGRALHDWISGTRVIRI